MTYPPWLWYVCDTYWSNGAKKDILWVSWVTQILGIDSAFMNARMLFAGVLATVCLGVKGSALAASNKTPLLYKHWKLKCECLNFVDFRSNLSCLLTCDELYLMHWSFIGAQGPLISHFLPSHLVFLYYFLCLNSPFFSPFFWIAWNTSCS